MNKQEIIDIIENNFDDDYQIKLIQNLIFKIVLPEVFNSVLPKEKEFCNCLAEIKQKAKELYGVEL